MPDTMTSNPYAAAYESYWDAGWRGILPLPYGKKTWPPEGTTGYAGVDPSFADCATWAGDGARNLCLRLPDGVIGIDVDHYDGRNGGDTLADLVTRHGALPPTAYSTSRGDGISGIRLYRVPPGTVLPTKLPGIEFIQRHHRYVVAWPSIHPSGNVYRWLDERTGEVAGEPPRLADLPDLPPAWLAGLATESKEHGKVDLEPGGAAAVIIGMPVGDPCHHILAHAGKAVAGGDRHDSYNEAVLAVLGAGRRGCPGAAAVINRLRSAFVAEIADRTTTAEAEAEWRRSMLGALAIVATEPQGHTCPDDVLVWLDDINNGDPDPDQQPETDTDPPERSPFDLAVARRVADMLIADAARDEVAARRAGQAPPLAGIGLADFLAQPDEDEAYRVDRMWPSQGRVLLPAAAKSGKTTMVVGNLLPCLLDGGRFLGAFDVTPVARRVVYLNMEVGERTMRAWLRRAGIRNTAGLTVVNLRGRTSALSLSSEAGRRRLSTFLRDQDAEVVILDPLAPALAVLGLDENSNADVAQFFSWWSEALGQGGVVDDLIAHHAGHAGERSRGASRLLDEPDAIWTMTRASVGDEGDVWGAQDIRFLRAMGRDVDLIDTALGFDPDTGLLTLRDGVTRRDVKKEGFRDAVLAYVKAHPGKSRTHIKETVPGSNDAVWRALAELIDDGEVIEDARKCYPNQ